MQSSAGKRRVWSPLALLTMMLGACGASDAPAVLPGAPIAALAPGDSLIALERPAAYAGTLPCADCPGIDALLILHPDGSYRLRERYRNRDEEPTVSVGRWLTAGDSLIRLTLFGGTEGPRHLAVSGALTLRALDRAGLPIATNQPLDLVRISAPPEVGGAVRMRGEFRYFADAATFVECAGGRQFPVGGDSAFIRLQRAHGAGALGTGAATLIDATGRLEVRPGMEEGTQLETFVVDSFVVRERSAACETTRVHALIAIGDWQLGALDGASLADLATAVRPTLRFVLSEPQLAGNAGCNRFTGRAVLRGLDLVPHPIALTQRMCTDSTVMAREARYSEVLGDGGWFRAERDTLVLSRGGNEVARFWRR